MTLEADIHEQLRRLNKIGIALSSERDLDKLLHLILAEARNFTGADAGSLYIRQGDRLRFAAVQNDTLEKEGSLHQIPLGEVIPLSVESIAGFVASTGKIVNIPDAYRLPKNAPYAINKDFDEKHGHRTQSILALPLSDPDGKVVGVLQLINAVNSKQAIVPFQKAVEALALSLASQAAVAVKNAMLTKELEEAHLDTIMRLSVAAEFRDKDTAAHLRKISAFSVIIAEQMRMPKNDIELLRYASPMHDIGKIGVPDSILLKPGKLTPEEYEEIKKHPIYGAKILEGSDVTLFKIAAEIALSHHEKYDGTGYPGGLKGKKIPLMGRIVAVPDVFDALTAKRVYKPAIPFDKTVEMIRAESGKHFDPEVVRAFMDSLDRIERKLGEFDKNGGSRGEEVLGDQVIPQKMMPH